MTDGKKEKPSGGGASEPGISPDVVAPVVRALEELGFDRQALEQASIDENTKPFVAGGAADALLDAAAAQLGDMALGLNVARRLPIGALGMLDYALCTSASLRESMERVARFYGVVTQRVKLTLEVAPPLATLVFERRPDVTHSRHWVEFSFGIFAERIRQTLGRDVTFAEVALRHAAPPSQALHDEFFGTRVTFSAPADRLSFASKLLDSPLVTAAASLAALLDQKLTELEPRMATPDALLTRVRHALVELLDQNETRIEMLAQRVHLTRRTLQRELQSRGTSHRQMLDHVRRERAQIFLAEGVLSITEVSERLGFSEPSAFFRAFRRWTGTSPRAQGKA
jgi:AraC-like DNA-binding protein